MKVTEKLNCRILADVLRAHGVKDVVISPGSRNAPLIIAFDSIAEIRKHVIIDERSAGFFALGIAEISRRPVALVCTSGSAPLNYGPALAEAFYRGIPLIAITADRTFEWIDQDDSQTIRQFRSLDNIVKKSYDIPDCNRDDRWYEWYVERIANDSYITSVKPPFGPVHVNVQLNEPLGNLIDEKEIKTRVIELIEPVQKLSDEKIKELCTELKGKRILLVAGFMGADNKVQTAVNKLHSLPQVVIMAETVSNLHFSPDCYSIDRVLSTLSTEELRNLRPDVIITIGGALISRKLKEYLRSLGKEKNPPEHWSIGHHHTTIDCFSLLTKRIEVAPQYILRKIFNQLIRHDYKSDFSGLWRDARHKADVSATTYIKNAPWSEIVAFDYIFRHLDEKVNLQISNGTSIRYCQLLAGKAYHSTYCNRGVSGIDGCTSTAIGAALASERNTVLVTGDMSFIYDISALTIPSPPSRLTIIVMNNSGGGIFRFVKSTADLYCREKYFCASSTVEIGSLAQTFGFDYIRAENESELGAAMQKIKESRVAPLLIEVKVPGDKSAELLRYFMNRNK